MEAPPRLVGGDVALDLVNSHDLDLPGGEYVNTDAEVTEWLAHVGLGGEARLVDFRRARTAVDRALRSGDTSALVGLYARATRRAELAPGGFTWASPLDAIIASAVHLLAFGPIDRLRTCGNCPWLFLDLSRNGSRRWCSMEGCGTEVKIRRLTERRRRNRGRVDSEAPRE
jgi:predicted RNA-binding Zn ribbon-like protein